MYACIADFKRDADALLVALQAAGAGDDGRFSDRELATTHYAFEESALPIRVDLVRWSQLPQSLRRVIEQTGASFNPSQV